MVTVEVRAHQGPESETLATLYVAADQSWRVDGRRPEAITGMFEVPVPALPEEGWITFADDPAGWARGLPYELRSGYLSAHVTEDL